MTLDSIESLSLLILVSLSYSSASRRLERLRRVVTHDRVPDMLGIWTFAGVVLLPAPLLVALVVAVDLGEYPSRRAVGNGRPGKYAYSIAATALSCVGAQALLHRVGGPLGVVVAAPAFWAMNLGLVVLAVLASRRSDVVVKMLRHWRAQTVDVGTQFLGAAVGFAMLWHVVTVVAAIPFLIGVHILTARRLVKEVAAYDSTTSLWSEEAWTVQAQDCVVQAPGCVLLMLIDPDVPGCEAGVAACMASIFSGGEPVGRYGTRQVVLVSQVDLECVGSILAADARDALADAGIACQVGTSISVGEGLDELLLRAGQDLMRRRDQAGITAAW